MRVLLLTFGTRGDIQPYIGLSTALIAAGHTADICTHPMHKPFIEEFGVGFVAYPGPHPQGLFDYCVKVGIFSYKFLLEVTQLAKNFMASWGDVVKTNHGKYDVVINTFTSINHGIMLAEHSNIPACTIHYVPVGSTKYYYSPYAPPGLRQSATKPCFSNKFSHDLIEYMFGIVARRPMNRTRKQLGLPAIAGFHPGAWPAYDSTPRIYCYSPNFLPKPIDYPDQTRTVGYYWLPEGPYDPPADIAEFLEKGAPVYVGFGSVNVPGSKTLIPRLIEGIKMVGERIIVFSPTVVEEYLDDPDIMFVNRAVPHSWLFPKIKIAIHHGGAGTVAYALKCGVPSIIMPFFGDHFLWSHRLQEMGCGPRAMPLSSTKPAELAEVLTGMLKDDSMRQKCRELADKVNAETAHQDTIDLLVHLHTHKCFPKDPDAVSPEVLKAELAKQTSGLVGTMAWATYTLFGIVQKTLSFPFSFLTSLKAPEESEAAKVK